MDGDMDYVSTEDNHLYRRKDERDVRACSSPESSAMEPGIEAQSVDQGRAGKVLEQAENGCEQFCVNRKRFLVR